jgi:hypothetical protein
MIIYNQEKIDGLEELIISKGSIKFDSEIKPILETSKASVKTESKDIFGMESILVSVGRNQNDDVFDPIETWRARSTPINKKFNYMHNEKDIIGHITSAKVLDADGNLIPDDIEESALPDFFEISVGSVMYTIWEDQELQDRASTLMQEIAKGKWFVSMEVYFSDFDYALSKGSETRIIERNEDTAFLTKHLKVYNGKGQYEGWDVCRKIKNMFFTGKGLVDNPANKRSLITSFNFSGAKASKNIFNEGKMDKDYEKSVAELAVAKEKLELATKEKQILAEQVDVLKGDLDSSKALSLDLKNQIEEFKKEQEAKDAKLAETVKALADVMTKAKNSDRVSELVNIGLDKTKAEEVAKKFSQASDEMFQEVVEMSKAKVEHANKTVTVTEATKDLEKTEASEEEDKKTPAQESTVDPTDSILAKASEFVSTYFNKGNK